MPNELLAANVKQVLDSKEETEPEETTQEEEKQPEKTNPEQVKWLPINRILQKWQAQNKLDFGDLVRKIITDLEELIAPNPVEQAESVKGQEVNTKL